METKVVVLGYVQRGGAPTARDRLLASLTGCKAVELLLEEGMTSKAIGIEGSEIIAIDLEEALNMPRKSNGYMMEMADILSI